MLRNEASFSSLADASCLSMTAQFGGGATNVFSLLSGLFNCGSFFEAKPVPAFVINFKYYYQSCHLNLTVVKNPQAEA
ncbi:hypothetical protein ACUN24_22560 [Pedobacter sp. WC2501]|uniref:hypothetical protein n=1 Tax=Pedobacter sp. WC2501 TaxID=3461400 RepID=UPI004045A71E